MKIILAGSWRFITYQETLSKALAAQGIDVVPFKVKDWIKGLFGNLEKYLSFRGLLHRNCEKKLVELCAEERPDVVFLWHYEMLGGEAIEAMKALGTKVVCYTNDDPFSPLYATNRSLFARRRWKHFKVTIPFYDKHLVFREHNVDEFIRAGAKDVQVMYIYYNPTDQYPRDLTEEDAKEYQADVVFIGHFEDGFKRECLEQVLDAGIDLKIFGQHGWDKPAAKTIANSCKNVIKPLWGADYAKALSGAQIGLCFLSRLNRDEYTTRSFEIPACGTVLLAERTPTHQRLYCEGEEAVFFSSPEELVELIQQLLLDPIRLELLAKAGRRRLLADGHSVDDRALFLSRNFESLL